MKIRKLISFVLTVIFVLGCVTSAQSVFASSAPADSVDAKNSKALIEALEIDVKSENLDAVTRAEFVYALMQTVKCAPSSLPELPFDDVKDSDYYASSLRYALALKVVSAAPSFNPTSPITWSQASKMLVVALGRDLEASLKGGWPYGYMQVASSAKLGEGTGLSGADDTITNEEFYIVLKNFLTSYMYEIDSISGDSFKYTGDRTVLEVFYGVFAIEGVVTSNANTSLYSAAAASSEGFIEIDETLYRYSGNCKIGDYVTAYIKEKSSASLAEVIYADSSLTEVFSIPADDIAGVSGTKIEYYDANGSVKSKTTIAYPAIIYNGKAYPDFDLLSVSGKDSRIDCIDNNDDGKVDVIRVYDASIMYVASIDAVNETILDKNEGVINLSANDASYTVISNGVNGDLSAIKANSAVTYYASNDKKLYEFVVSTETVTGIFEGYNAANGEYVIDQTTYEASDYFKKHYANKLALGTKISVVLSANGELVALESAKSADTQYGYLIEIGRTKGLESALRAKILTKNEGVKVFEISDKVLLDGVRTSGIAETESFLRAYMDARDASIENHLNAATPKYTFITATSLIKFSKDSDDVVTMIDTANTTGQLKGDEPLDNALTRYAFPSDKVDMSKHVYSGITYLRASKILHPYFRIDESATVFIINLNDGIDDAKKYNCTDGSYFTTHTSVETARFIAYDVDAVGLVSTVVIFTGSTGAGSLNNESPAGMVASISEAIGPDDEKGIRLTLLNKGQYTAYYITDIEVLKAMLLDTSNKSQTDFYNPDATFSNPGIAVGDYVRLECDWRNIISVIGKEYDATEGKLLKTFEHHGNEEIDYYYGKVYAKSEDIVSLVPTLFDSFESDKTIEERSRFTFNVPGLLTVYDSATKKVSVSTIKEILPYTVVGENCDHILVKLDKNSAVADIVVYK